MAISGGDGSIILSTKVETSGIKKGLNTMKTLTTSVGKAFAAIGVATAATTVAITKMAVSAYAEYEQLVGGVETLFKGSADKVMAYAENAFATAGVSANEYMSIVTSFSASLLQSLGGDTDAAADIANQALIDMSDNANKMGTSMEMIQNAYQGFAKQNYTMLDNLKLGYGGTKTEMERLLADAQELTGVKYDISNLADVYNAIHAIQENLGIAGTTAKEAEETISGSANMMKAAWQNVLAAIAGGGDLDRAINNLVYSIQKYFENIVPVIERALSGIGTLIERVAPMLVQTVAKSLIKAIPSLLNAVYQMILGLAKGIYEGISALFSGETSKIINKQTNEIQQSVKNQNELTDAVEETNEAQEKTLAGFDEINVLSAKASENSVDAASLPSGAGVQSTGINIPVKVQESNMSWVSGFLKKLEPVKSALNGLFDALKPLGSFSSQALQDFYNYGLKPIADWTMGVGLPKFINAITVQFESVNWGNLNGSLKNLWKSVSPFATNIGEGLLWFWEAVITPFISWSLNNLIPAALDLVSSALSFLSEIVEAIMPNLEWFWNTFMVPIRDFIWDLIIGFLNLLTDAFTALSNWAKENPEAMENIATIILGFLAGLWVYNTTKKIIGFMSTLIDKFIEFGGLQGMMTAMGGAINSPALAIAALVAAGLFWVKNWDKIKSAFQGMESWQKVIVVVLGLAAAIAVLWVALSVGVAAATIVAGLAALGLGAGILAIGKANEKKNTKPSKNLKSVPSDSVVASSVPTKTVGGYSIPALAQGAVIPANREFLAVLGDQKNGRNLEAPENLIRQIVREESGAGDRNITIQATGSMAQLIRMLNLEIREEQKRASVF